LRKNEKKTERERRTEKKKKKKSKKHKENEVIKNIEMEGKRGERDTLL
jgi:ABC-type polysaccharide/polyol phosphate transport system ATPase subunit